MKRAGLTPKIAITTITTLATLIGAIKTITTETTGSALPAGHLLFYIGGSAIALYIACAAGAMFGAGAVMGLASIVRADDSKPAGYLALAAGLLVGGVMMVLLTSAGVLWDYDGLDQFGRTFVALVGLAMLALPVYLYVRDRKD